ncbi:MAG: DUF4893 domain-containing protein [Hyphomicrobiaceae bacterium]|nr:DUF4893 domain-containing protein [Hyphomicrobiaceae bacterium]MCC0024994.1 DUF4893 domain-containing protein [Hyphomicrobiaceae bacterium]
MRKLVFGLGMSAAMLFTGGIGFAAPFMCDSKPLLDATPDDISRMDNFYTSRTRGLGAALAAESDAEQKIVSELFESGLAPVDETLLPGNYECRTIKMGGISPLVVYSWFRCEIRPEEAVYTIRKTTGSQNFFGVLRKRNDLFVYQGASSYGYEDGVRLYGDDEERNQVGCLSAVTKGNRHFILELPFPRFESYHDVIELRPVN